MLDSMHSGRHSGFRPKCSAWVVAAAAITLFYFAFPAALLRWNLDRLVFSASPDDQTHEDKRFEWGVAPGTTIVVRRYGEAGHSCVFFFPGQHGGIAGYERTLFPSIRSLGADIYAISYPGQDGARGQSRIDLLPDQVALAISQVSKRGLCNASHSVFIGRSLGATVALVEASRFKPEGLLADGLGAELSQVIRTWIDRHWSLIGWKLLPIRTLVGRQDFSTPLLIEKTPSMPVVVFQGTADEVTPYALVQNLPEGHPNVCLIPVVNASHENAYLLARDAYIENLRLMLKANAAAAAHPCRP
ncbi:alpha/beta hydrolase [Dyella monticola]|uniref:Alpha/beta hydrolase n=1 Tax=Dyella monticola TaxID=1927958 RepID=A0A370X5I3_9GAMM|nr:alpha/beta hydrolase [Dyella monticola]RDS83537.1 alpha/beta hydrolase [Dyella monticola]